MQILITGAGGFVGRHFAKRLLDDGHDVVGVDDLSTGLPPPQWPFGPENYPVWFTRDCREWFRQYAASGFDLIIHCAAVVGGRLKIEGDPLAVATDLAIDSDFFRWCVADRDHLPKKVIYFSSSAVYPVMYQTRKTHFDLRENLVNLDGDLISMPDQTYGWSKLTGELLARYAARTYGLDVAIYRPFSGYGEDQDAVYPFPAIVRRVLDRQDPLVVWGSGDQQRDFIHIDDIVECVLRTKDELTAGDALNLGTGIATSFVDLAELICQRDARGTHILTDNLKPEGVFSRVADVTRMRAFYKPKITLAEGIERVYRHLDKARTPA